MAFIANTAFEARITNNQFDDLANVTGKYQASNADADCSAGLLCVRGNQLPCEGFAGVNNENAWQMTAASASADAATVVYACNTYESQLLGDGNGNLYRVGHKTLGLGVPAGRYGTFTRINFDGQSVYRFGIGNVSAAIGSNTAFTIANGMLVPGAAPTAEGSVYFKLRGTGNFVEGTSQSFGYVDVVAMQVV